MTSKLKSDYSVKCLFTLFAILVLCSTLYSQNVQEIIVTIAGINSSDKVLHFNAAEELRSQMKFQEAIEEYKYVISQDNLCGKEAEAHYNIGLCYTWMVKKDDAEAVFQKVLETYPDNKEVVAYSKYCLAWIDVQHEKFEDAIKRLENILDENLYTDKEYCAKVQFQIGRINLVFLQDEQKAHAAFQNVLAYYPDTKVINHPFLAKLKEN
jgi:tetratricopeptide (TPR) repeat protein